MNAIPVVHLPNKKNFEFGNTFRFAFGLALRVKQLDKLISSFDHGWARTCRNIALLAIAAFIGYTVSFRASFATVSVLGVVRYLISRFKNVQTQNNSEEVTDLYAWRHGETDSNVSEILSGGGDVEAALTDKGKMQAAELAQKISRRKLHLEVVYSSDLPRALDTAKAVVAVIPPTEAEGISSTQLREVLHGQYERTPAAVRNEKAAECFKQELEKMEKDQKDISNAIKEGRVDQFHFYKIHPLSTRVKGIQTPITNVRRYCTNPREPETVYELFLRSYAEFVRIADESHHCGYTTVGISTHGGVISSLVDAAKYGKQNVFIPPFYQREDIQVGGKKVMPAATKISNCALTHFRYWHKSKRLEFCGMVD